MTTGAASALLNAAQATEPVAWRIRIAGTERIHLTRHETADLLGLTYEQVRHLIRLGRVTTVRRGTRIPAAAVFGFLRIPAQDSLLGDYRGTPRLALSITEAADALGVNPQLLRRDLAASGLPTGWTGHMHVIPISTVLALAEAGEVTSKAA